MVRAVAGAMEAVLVLRLESKTDALDARHVRLIPNIVERRLDRGKSSDTFAR
jgi:hypothetical protein